MGKEADLVLGRIENYGTENPKWRNVPREMGEFLRSLVEIHRPHRILEAGTSNGYSAIWLGLGAVEIGATVVTLEKNEWKAEVARKNIRESGLEATVEVITGVFQSYLSRQISIPEFIFLDILSSEYLGILNSLRGRIKPGTIIVADNILTHREKDGSVKDNSQESREYIATLKGINGVSATQISTLGSGVSIVYFRRSY